MKPKSLPSIASQHKRDASGFAVRRHHLQRYNEYAGIYKETLPTARIKSMTSLICLGALVVISLCLSSCYASKDHIGVLATIEGCSNYVDPCEIQDCMNFCQQTGYDPARSSCKNISGFPNIVCCCQKEGKRNSHRG